METLSPEHRLVLELYKKERPDIFARLPLPKKIAEEYGVPIKTDTVHLMDFMRNHLAIASGHYDAYEERVACSITDASGNEIKPISMNKVEDTVTGEQFYTSKIEAAFNIGKGGTNAAFVPK